MMIRYSGRDAYIFVTGASGFIGHHVLAGLLEAGKPCASLLRDEPAKAAQRLEALLGPLQADVPDLLRTGQLVLLQGDVNHALPDVRHLPISSVVHTAGVTTFEPQPNGDPVRTNVHGTTRLLAWAEAHGVRECHLVSSAYQCGRASGPSLETLSQACPDFLNDYEQSKWQAEQLAAQWATSHGNSLTIYRPSIVVGDQVRFRTTSFSGFYLMARATQMLWQWYEQSPESRLRTGLRIEGEPTLRQNLIPVDHVANAIVHAVCSPQWHGRIYHLTHPAGTTNAAIKQALDEYYGFAGSDFTADASHDSHAHEPTIDHDAHRLFHDATRVLRGYLSHSPVFDRTNAQALEADAGLCCPPVDVTFLKRLVAYAQDARWGRRATSTTASRRPNAVASAAAAADGDLIDLYFTQYLPAHVLMSRVASTTAMTVAMRFIISDMHEGQWLCHFERGRLVSVTRSDEPADEAFTYTTTRDIFWQAIAGQINPQDVFMRDLATIQGDMESAIRMIMILHQFNREWPCTRQQLMQMEASPCKAD